MCCYRLCKFMQLRKCLLTRMKFVKKRHALYWPTFIIMISFSSRATTCFSLKALRSFPEKTFFSVCWLTIHCRESWSQDPLSLKTWDTCAESHVCLRRVIENRALYRSTRVLLNANFENRIHFHTLCSVKKKILIPCRIDRSHNNYYKFFQLLSRMNRIAIIASTSDMCFLFQRFLWN